MLRIIEMGRKTLWQWLKDYRLENGKHKNAVGQFAVIFQREEVNGQFLVLGKAEKEFKDAVNLALNYSVVTATRKTVIVDAKTQMECAVFIPDRHGRAVRVF